MTLLVTGVTNGTGGWFAQIGGVSVVISQSIKNGSQFIVGEKLEIKPLPQFWQQRLGTYQVMNDPLLNGETIEVSRENNLILADEYIITPVTDELAIIRGLGRGSWEAVQFKEVDGQEVMYWSGLQFSKVNTPTKQLKPSLLKRL